LEGTPVRDGPDSDADERIISKWTFKETVWKVCTGLIWLSTGARDGLFSTLK
jgi:hypothetical protein